MERLSRPPHCFVGLAGLVAGVLVRNYRPSWTAVWPVLLVIGGLVLLFGLYASFATNVRRAPARVAPTATASTRSILVVLILGVIVLVEAVSYRHSYRIDLTENKRWSLSPQTVKVVAELPDAGEGGGVLPARPAGQAHGGGSPQAVRGAAPTGSSPGRSSTPTGTHWCPAVRLRELRDASRLEATLKDGAEEAGEDPGSRRGEADERAHPGHAARQAASSTS